MKTILTIFCFFTLSVAGAQTAVDRQFTKDTTAIEKKLEQLMDSEPSTVGMSNALFTAKESYNLQLNKYYKLLGLKMQYADRIVLVNAQKSWIVFRDNEIKLLELLADSKYSGGGTMQLNFLAYSVLELTKHRAVEIFEHYRRVMEFE